MLPMIGSSAFGATCGWLCAMKAGPADANRRFVGAVLCSAVLTAAIIYLMLGPRDAAAFAGGMLVFWLMHVAWQRNIQV